MSNRTILIFFLAILSFALASCQQEPERTKSKNQENIPSSAKGITIKLEKEQYLTEDTEAVLTLHNDSETTFLYGREYLLGKNIDGTWYEIEFNERIGFTAIGYNLVPGQNIFETISLDIFNEELSAGHYRLIKEFSEAEKEYSPENKIIIAASFKLVEP
ncbi:hypothetical protein RG959_15430 [Domibacillus sp. 8LH]|uniref:immunoglobulin-like domain-containing protein n=1 Tax=Domibacillus sp. 8LH TaxID=3073900 RepID=UPI00317295E7